MEHVILKRINSYMEDNGLFLQRMIGFRPKLPAQDVMLRLKYDVVDGAHCSPLGTRAILGLVLTKAFDNAKHPAIFANLSELGIGKTVYAYISNFSDRTATLALEGIESDAMKLGNRGTPQGSVLTTFLFNVAIIGLPKILNRIEGIQHSLYADDVTLWVPAGSNGRSSRRLRRPSRSQLLSAKIQAFTISTNQPVEGGAQIKPLQKSNFFLVMEHNTSPKWQAYGSLAFAYRQTGHNSETIPALKKKVY